MGYILTGDQQRVANRRIGEILRQFGQDEYPYDPKRALHALQDLSEGRFETMGNSFPSVVHAADLIPERWEVIIDVSPSEFDVSDLDFFSYLERDEQRISVMEVYYRALRSRANLGLADGQKILEHQDEISKDLCDKSIILPGTVLRHPDGNLFYPFLCHNIARWVTRFVNLLGRNCGSYGLLARHKRE